MEGVGAVGGGYVAACFSRQPKPISGSAFGSRDHLNHLLRPRIIITSIFAAASGCTPAPVCCSTTSNIYTAIPAQQTLQEEDMETAQSSRDEPSQPNTVRVKFMLEKECLFGQHFFLVGDDPVLGKWEPAGAIPLEWSDGHIWFAELDLPVGISIKFKFLLCCLSGEIKWQPGPDRVLKTWETTNVITVWGGWDNADDQKITEQPAVVSSAENISGTTTNEVINEDQKEMNISSKVMLPGDQDQVLVPSLPLPSDEAQNRRAEEHKLESSEELAHKGQPDMTLEISDGLSTMTLCDDGRMQPEEAVDSQSIIDVFRDGNSWGRETFNRFLLALGLSLQGLS